MPRNIIRPVASGRLASANPGGPVEAPLFGVPWFLVVAVAMMLAILPLGLSGFLVQTLTTGFYWIMLGISWNLLAGYTGQFSLAQHTFAAIGAYAAGLIGNAWGLPPLLTIPVGAVAAGVVGYALAFVTLRMRGIYFVISTWAFAEATRMLIIINYQFTRGDAGLAVPLLFGTFDPVPYYYLMLAFAAATFVFSAILLRTRLGYRMIAIRDDQELAAATGIDVRKWKRVAFLITTAIAGLAGGLYGYSVGLVSPAQADFSQLAFVVIAVMLGGFRSLWGPVVGGLVVQVLSEALRFSLEWRLVLFAVMVIIVVRFYPYGIVGLIQQSSNSVIALRTHRAGNAP